jgi:hypothetical protein
VAHVQVTWATLRSRLFERVDSAQHWVNAEALIKTNNALRFWNLLTGMWRRSVSVVLSPGGDPYYALTGTMIWPMRMELSDGTVVPKVSIASLDLGQPTWEGETTADGGSVPAAVTFWAPRELQLFTVWPRPTVSTTVTFDGVSETPVLSADGDFIDLEDDVFEVLLNYAAHLLQFKDGGPKFFGTAPAWNAMVTLAGDYNSELRTTSIYRKALGRDTDRDHHHRMRELVPEVGQTTGEGRR